MKENKKLMQGEVLSDKMEKTVVVSVKNRKIHPLYKKYVGVTKKVFAHNRNNEAKMGDVVRIIESRPLSRHKRWEVISIVSRAK